MNKCPECGASGAYVGFLGIECANQMCRHFISSANVLRVIKMKPSTMYMVFCSDDFTVRNENSGYSHTWEGGLDIGPWSVIVWNSHASRARAWTLHPCDDSCSFSVAEAGPEGGSSHQFIISDLDCGKQQCIKLVFSPNQEGVKP